MQGFWAVVQCQQNCYDVEIHINSSEIPYPARPLQCQSKTLCDTVFYNVFLQNTSMFAAGFGIFFQNKKSH